MKKNDMPIQNGPFLAQPMTGQVLTVLFALCFYFQCIFFPL
jgi:hypothetical protein